jgi:8-oxo-dGTP pyrophosphatase MutT (NUDIX family)
MQQMYKVFISGRPLIIRRRQGAAVELRDGHLHFHCSGQEELNHLLNLLHKDPDIRAVYAYNEVPENLLAELKSMLTVVEAAGGFVINQLGEALFIFRRGHWDLPKGKLDAGETPRDAAIREVAEECGIEPPSIEAPLGMSYHIYKENDQLILKPTHWFLMRSTDTAEPQPQIEEDITEARWVQRKHWRELTKLSFPSVADLVEEILSGDVRG